MVLYWCLQVYIIECCLNWHYMRGSQHVSHDQVAGLAHHSGRAECFLSPFSRQARAIRPFRVRNKNSGRNQGGWPHVYIDAMDWVVRWETQKNIDVNLFQQKNLLRDKVIQNIKLMSVTGPKRKSNVCGHISRLSEDLINLYVFSHSFLISQFLWKINWC